MKNVSPTLPNVKAVTVCSSSRFYGTARRVADELAAQGFKVHTPRFDYNEQEVEVGPEDKNWLTRDSLDRVRAGDLVYVVDEGGYTGPSVCIEVGYAAALGKTIVLSEQPTEHAVMALAAYVVPVELFSAALMSSRS